MQTTRAEPSVRSYALFSVPTWLLALMLAVLAVLPRVLGLADFYTIDEAYHWVYRIRRFSEALAARDWAATDLTGHPGVTTMWLGWMGRALGALFGIRDMGGSGAGATYLSTLRFPLALTNGLTVVCAFLILRRLVRPSVALLAGVFWATSPFLIGLGRLLHMDGLLTSFMALSVLLMLLALVPTTSARASWVALLGSGVCAGLALLTKAPSLFLLPFCGLLLAAWHAWQVALWRHRTELLRAMGWVFGRYAVWLGTAALMVVALWPAMWVTPLSALGDVLNEIIANGGSPEPAGNFFMGKAVAAPGPLFYPAVLLWRTTPWALLGLLLLPLAFRAATSGGANAPQETPERSTERMVLVAMLAFAVLFGLMMTLQPKQFDRYLLPIWPALQVLAAAGWVTLLEWIGRRRPQRWLSPVVYTLLRLFALGTTAWYQPYQLGYFNPLLGGGAVGQRVMLVGLGEGMEQIGAWLRERPDLKRGPVLSWIPPTLSPFVPASPGVLDLRVNLLETPTSYAVLYSRSVQRKESAVAEEYVRQNPPLFTLRVHGVEYATVHQLPRPYDTPLDAQFGDGLRLRGYTLQREGDTLTLTPSWSVLADQPGGKMCFVHVLATDGQRVTQIDAALDQGMFAEWQAGQQFDTPFPLQLPSDLPPGEYRVVMGVYTLDGGRLPLVRGPSAPGDLAGPDALLVATLDLP